MSARPAIEVRQLEKSFGLRGLIPGRPRGRVLALAGVGLSVGAGTIHGLVGPNGSGKSTLLRVLATLITPDAGQAVVAGRDVTRDGLAVRRGIGFSTGEERSFYWRLTGRQNLEFYARLHHLGDATTDIRRTLYDFGLVDVADRTVSTYSQGMQRRLGLARAILHRPPVLLLDEPARSLDRASRDDLHAILRKLRSENGTAILIATHDVDEAVGLCDAVSVLRKGRVVTEVIGPSQDRLEAALLEAET